MEQRIEIASPAALRSIIQEAGRQCEFFHRRGDKEVSDAWAAIESLAFEAKAHRRALHIMEKGDQEGPFPIIPCEQGQQPRKGFNPKVLQ